MAQDWDIKGRAESCATTGRSFTEGEFFYTLLYLEPGGFRREDLSEEAWAARNDNIRPFSFWRTKFEPPPAKPKEPLAKETAEELLRRYMGENDPAHENSRYLLAVMLERKRILKPVDEKKGDGRRLLIYEHAKTGEVFVIPDPELRLDQIESVQNELAGLLA